MVKECPCKKTVSKLDAVLKKTISKTKSKSQAKTPEKIIKNIK